MPVHSLTSQTLWAVMEGIHPAIAIPSVLISELVLPN